MISRLPHRPVRPICLLLVAVVALVNSGCLIVAAGACAGGAAGYIYCKGKVCENFVADFGDAWSATHAAMQELRMSIEKEDRSGMTGTIQARTPDGQEVRVDLETTISPIPTEGSITRVGVRVATFGDTDFSEHFLHQVSTHLHSAPPGSGPIVPTTTPVPVATAPPPAAPAAIQQASTAPPPLAPVPVSPPPGKP